MIELAIVSLLIVGFYSGAAIIFKYAENKFVRAIGCILVVCASGLLLLYWWPYLEKIPVFRWLDRITQ